MKTILEIQKLDRQIHMLEREVEKCPASVNFKNYKKILQEGKLRFEQLENQANEIIKNYNSALNKLSKCKGESEIIRKRNVATINLENANALYARANVIANTKNQEVVNAFIAKYANVEKYLANMDIKTKERIENDTTRNFAYLPVADGSNKNFLA